MKLAAVCTMSVREMRVRTRVLIGPSLPREQWTRLKWLINKPGACLDYWDISQCQGAGILHHGAERES